MVESCHRCRNAPNCWPSPPRHLGDIIYGGRHNNIYKDKYGIPGAPSGLKGTDDPIVFHRQSPFRVCLCTRSVYKYITYTRAAIIIHAYYIGIKIIYTCI